MEYIKKSIIERMVDETIINSSIIDSSEQLSSQELIGYFGSQSNPTIEILAANPLQQDVMRFIFQNEVLDFPINWGPFLKVLKKDENFILIDEKSDEEFVLAVMRQIDPFIQQLYIIFKSDRWYLAISYEKSKKIPESLLSWFSTQSFRAAA